MDLFSLDSVILIMVTCNCLPFSYSRSIFRRYISWQSAENSISEPPNLKIFWPRIPPLPLQDSFAIMPPPPPRYISCDLIETNIKTEIILSKDYWNYGEISTQWISRNIENNGECACWGTLHSEKVVWNKNKSCYRYKWLVYFIKFTYDNELYI